MGYTYYANATFPQSARKVPAIDEYLNSGKCWEVIQEGNGIICASCDQASNGELNIAKLLEEHKIPYDHYHRDDNACEIWTVKYRLDDAGNLVEVTSESEQDEELSNFAERVLKAMENGETEEVYALLREVISTTAPIEAISAIHC